MPVGLLLYWAGGRWRGGLGGSAILMCLSFTDLYFGGGGTLIRNAFTCGHNVL